MPSKPWTAIEGGWSRFEHAYTRGALLGAVKQSRYSEHLGSLGPPGAARWDPGRGEVELRGHTFEAEQLGSFDGHSWLWSWSNEFLRLPDARTTCSRRLRDLVSREQGIAAFGVPTIESTDERLSYMMASLALAHLEVEGYYLANQSQVYLILPGQVPPPKRSRIDELRGALEIIKSEPLMPRDLMTAVPFAAKALGLAFDENSSAISVRDGAEELVVDKAGADLSRLAVCFLPRRTNLDSVIALLAPDRQAPNLAREGDAGVARGDGWQVRIRVEDRLRSVMREANALPNHVDRARGCSTVVIVETVADPAIEDGLVPHRGSWAPASMMVEPVGTVAYAAIRLCESLNRLEGAIVYDTRLRSFYPEA